SRHGAVAQLGERLNGIEEADGSIPFSSTKALRISRVAQSSSGVLGKRADERGFEPFPNGVFAGGGARAFGNTGVEAARCETGDRSLGVLDRSGLDDL